MKDCSTFRELCEEGVVLPSHSFTPMKFEIDETKANPTGLTGVSAPANSESTVITILEPVVCLINMNVCS